MDAADNVEMINDLLFVTLATFIVIFLLCAQSVELPAPAWVVHSNYIKTNFLMIQSSIFTAPCSRLAPVPHSCFLSSALLMTLPPFTLLSEISG